MLSIRRESTQNDVHDTYLLFFGQNKRKNLFRKLTPSLSYLVIFEYNRCQKATLHRAQHRVGARVMPDERLSVTEKKKVVSYTNYSTE